VIRVFRAVVRGGPAVPVFGLGGVLLLLFLFLAGAAGRAGNPQAPQQQPTFRAGAHFVRVDAYPVRDGRIIRDLTASDFDLLEDGRPQPIETIEFIEFESWTPEAERRDPNSVQEGFRLAADPRYRVFVIYYDVHHVPVMAAARLRVPLAHMVERMLGPRDLVGLLTPRDSPDALTLGQRAFGIERQLDRILEANTVGADLHTREESLLFTCYPWMTPEQLEAVIRTRRLEKVYSDLRALVARLGALREERKNIVVLSSNLTGPPLNVPDQSGPRRQSVGTTPTGRLGIDPRNIPVGPDRRWCDEELGRLRLFEDGRERRDLIVAARLANVAIYAVSPVGLGGENTGEPGYDLMSAHTNSLLELANETDALAVVATNDLNVGLGRIVEDVSAYYTLGYYTTNTRWDGGRRRIEVRLRSSGERVRARREYRAPTEAEMASARAAFEHAPAAGPGPVDVALAGLARVGPRTPLFARGVHAGGRLYVAVELPSAAAAGAWSSGATVRVEAASRDAGGAGSLEARIEPGQRGALAVLPAAGSGPWQVSVGVAGRAGTLNERIDVPSAGEGAFGAPLLFRATPSPRSPLLPAAEPVFRRTERAHLEWRLAVRPERSEARLLNARGEPLAVPVTLSSRAEPDAVVLVADVNLAPLAAADYVIELTGTSGGREGRSLLAFRITR
jgi:VWFA-related protein